MDGPGLQTPGPALSSSNPKASGTSCMLHAPAVTGAPGLHKAVFSRFTVLVRRNKLPTFKKINAAKSKCSSFHRRLRDSHA